MIELSVTFAKPPSAAIMACWTGSLSIPRVRLMSNSIKFGSSWKMCRRLEWATSPSSQDIVSDGNVVVFVIEISFVK
ncbi:hypothetical protein [Amorphus sp. MBR-141]